MNVQCPTRREVASLHRFSRAIGCISLEKEEFQKQIENLTAKRDKIIN